jgi:hypothetical protein
VLFFLTLLQFREHRIVFHSFTVVATRVATVRTYFPDGMSDALLKRDGYWPLFRSGRYLFNDAVNSLDYVAPNYGIIQELEGKWKEAVMA